jgi:DedD protein
MAANTSRVIELALVFLVTLLSFSIGTYVGKKYSDNQHKLAQLEPGVHDGEHKVASEESHDKKSESHGETTAQNAGHEAMTDEDVAKIAEEFAQEEEPSKNIAEVDEHGKPVVSEKVVMAPSKVAKIGKTEKSEQHHTSAPTDLKRDVANISEKAKNIGLSPSQLQYTVQVGAYTSTSDAEKMTETLKSRGYKAAYVAAEVNGKTYYRVQVGLFSSLDEAQVFKKEIMEKNQLTSAIIQKISQSH